MSRDRYDKKNLKITQWAALILQVLFVVLIFLPAGNLTDSRLPVNSLQMGLLYLKYGDWIHFIGGLLYCVPLLVLPVAIWLITFLRKTRSRYGVCIGMCSWEFISSSIFYTVVAHRMSGILTLKSCVCYAVVLLEILNAALFLHAFMLAWKKPN
ncbi:MULTISPECIES: hypothetical protein [Caproicibacterium]|jgi:hypothetical protein|uniref:DUF2569 family protein n=1 Tax=Caproicibacterium lactatifermentans TaxID=2666138 RepID=A0A859DSD5_9FIRM|nr:hypothetical protein [Caproicibacterium lactatifermentans]ARP49430.1 hypothetical protein B6259_00115 [Ruminococcaceae bacterium CPB6]QKN23023.1 hypothetical protein GJQ69_00115 [Caproicibacterium lactatifermentans]QKO30371.1 hypothetical protein GKP14_04665 [Caproicibacterium lactatifermentans]